MIQYGVSRDFANLAVDLFAVGTLKVPGSSAAGIPIGQIVDGTAQTLTASTTRMVYASGGTYIGSALYSTSGVNAGDFTTPLDVDGNFTAPDNESFAVYGSANGNANYDLKVELSANQPGDFVVIQNLGAHTFVPILARKIYVTDAATTATNLLVLR